MTDIKAMHKGKEKYRSIAQAGNAIVMLFAAIGMAGVVTYGLNNVIRGPAVTTAEVSRRSIAENNLVATTRLAIASATNQQASEGDCDGDGFVEPLPFRDAGAGPHPVGGGYIPSTMGASMSDPWGNQYGYCVWDPGTVSVSDAMASCGGATPRRLQGAPRDDQYALAVISAGRNGVFETQCRDYVDTTPADNVPDNIMLETSAGSDDIVLGYTYAEANGIGGGEWRLKDGTPGTAEIGKNIALGSSTNPRGAAFEQGLELGGARGLILPRDPGDDTITGACTTDKADQLRLNIGDGSAIPTLEICFNNAWTVVSGGTQVGGGATCGTLGPWTTATAPYGEWHDFMYVNNQFVGVGGGAGNVATSPDGITWTNRTAPAGFWRGIAYGNNTYVAVGSGTNRAMTSPDGITWTARAVPEANSWASVAFGNGIFVAVSYDGTNRVMTSPDGITWTLRTQSEVADWGSVSFLNGQFVASGQFFGGPNRLMTSADGINWTSITNNQNSFGTIRYNADDSLYYSQTGGSFLSSPDLQTWSSIAPPAGLSSVTGVMYGGGQYAAISFAGDPRSAVSTDGLTWTARPAATNDSWLAGAYGNGVFVAGAANGPIMYAACTGSTGAVAGSCVGLGSDYYDDPVTGHCYYKNPDDLVATDAEAACRANGGYLANITSSVENDLIRDNIDGSEVLMMGGSDAEVEGTWKYTGGELSGQLFWSGTASGSALGGRYNRWHSGEPNADGATEDCVATYQPGYGEANAAWIDFPCDVAIASLCEIGGTDGSSSLSTPHPLDTGLIAHWKMDEATGTTVADSVGDNNGTFVNTPEWAAGADGASSLNFQHADEDSVLINGLLGEPANGTISTWVNVANVEDLSAEFISLGDNVVLREHIDRGLTLIIYNGGSVWGGVPSDVSIRGTGWRHVVGTWGDEIQRIYVDGVLVAQVTGNPVNYSLGGNTKIGDHGGSGVFSDMDGGLDDMRVYDRALSPLEVQQLYERSLASSWVRKSTPPATLTTNQGLLTSKSPSATSCAIKPDGSAWCWGNNSNGQLGIGSSAIASVDIPNRVKQQNIHQFKQISAGVLHTCGITADNNAWCWGDDAQGQRGDGTTSTDNASVPRLVSGGAVWSEISAGSYFTCGIYLTGVAYCWGVDTENQLGNGAGVTTQTSPVAISGGGLYQQIVAGTDHACGIRTDGSGYCWGRGNNGQIGNGATSNQNVPTAIAGNKRWKDIAVGASRTCGVSTDGGLFCWGWWSVAGSNVNSPLRVAPGETWEDVEVGNNHNCATKTDGTLWCWGLDGNGRLGNGPTITATQLSPIRVSLSGPVMAYAVGSDQVCAMEKNGALWCWGEDTTGSLGNGAITADQDSPSAVLGFPNISPWIWNSTTNAFQLNAGMTIALGDKWVSDDGSARYFGFVSAGKARLRQTGVSNQLLVETAAATNSAQVSFKKGTPAVAGVDYTTGRIAEWLFNETTGTTVSSSVGAFPGTASGTTSWNPTGGRTPTNGVLEFDGISGRVSVANNATLRPAGTFTIRVWVRPDGLQTGGATILSKTQNNGARHSYGLVVNKDQKVEFVTTNASLVSHSTVSTDILRPNAWTLIEAGFIDAGGGNFVKYISLNGQNAFLGTSVTSILYSTDATGNLFFGGAGCVSPCNSFRGAIDDVRIYNTIISASSASMNNFQTSAVVPKAIGIDHATNNLEIGTQNATATNWISAITPDLALTSAGDVGMGTASPATKVDVSGSVRVGFESSCTAGGAGAIRYTGNLADETTFTCPASSWRLQDASGSRLWSDVVYGNGIFVAVAQAGTNGVMTSPDGITWTQRTTPNGSWHAVAYGNGIYVATNWDTGNYMTSTDGITWTARTKPSSRFTGTVRFLNGQFIVTGDGDIGAIFTSTNGLSWTSADMPSNESWRSISYGNGVYLATSPDGIGAVSWDARTWTRVTTGIFGVNGGVTFGGGVFVVGGTGSTVGYSRDGINWSTTNAPNMDGITKINYSNGQFVAVSAGGTRRIGVSKDGVTWTTLTAPQANFWSGIAYGNGRYVAVSEDGSNQVMTSDCEAGSGSSIPAGAIGYWKFDETSGTTAADSAGSNPGTLNGNATFGAGRKGNALVLDGSGDFANMGSAASLDNLPMTSGCAWVYGPASQPGTYQGIVNKTDGSGLNGYSLYVGDHRGTTSLEFGSTTRNNGYREEADLVPPNTWTHICSTWNGTNPIGALKIYVNGTEINTGLDYDFAGSGSISDASYNLLIGGTAGSYFQGMIDEVVLYNRVLTAAEVGQVMSATGSQTSSAYSGPYTCTGQNWTTRGTISVVSSLAFGNGLFVAVGGYPEQVATSPDGINWTYRTHASGHGWFSDVVYGNGQFVATSYDGPGRVMTSPDGINWTSRTAAELNAWNGITYGGGQYVAVAGSGTNRVMTSPDGITWTARSAPIRAWEDIAYGNGVYVAMTADNDRRMTSPDGITWTEQPTTNGWGRIAFGDGLFLISRADGIETSPDGVTLTNRTVPAGDWYGMTYDATSDLWIAVSYQGTNRIMTSPDAINWTARSSPSTANFNHVASGNGVIVALAGNGTVMTSSCTPVPKYQYCNGTAWSDFVAPTTTYWKKNPYSIAAGWGFSDDASVCSIAAGGSAYCWGDANNKGLGNNQEVVDNLVPGKVHDNSSPAGWNDWIQISGIENRCGLRANGTIWCWGYGWGGRLGNGDGSHNLRPVQVQTNTGPGAWNDWIQVTGWMDHFCGLRANGTAWCWGDERLGQLGNGSNSSTQSRPVQVQTDTGPGGWSDWIQLEAGWSNTCGLRRGGTVWCWGSNGNGSLGDGTTTNTTRPVQVQTDTGPGGWDDWTQISFADDYGCGIREDGSAWCWGGWADSHRRGTGCTAAPDSRPRRVRTSTNGTGWNDWKLIKAGRETTCGIRNDGSLWCWGWNAFGIIGNNTTTESCLPVEVHSSTSATGWKDWMNVAVGRAQTCGVRANGTLWCWGSELSGQLGNGASSSTLRLRPVAVTSPP